MRQLAAKLFKVKFVGNKKMSTEFDVVSPTQSIHRRPNATPVDRTNEMTHPTMRMTTPLCRLMNSGIADVDPLLFKLSEPHYYEDSPQV